MPANKANAIACGIVTIPTVIPANKSSIKEYLFDELRKKWILSTPEELVRQQFWKYLHLEKKYPKSLMAIEKKIVINGLNKRFDLLVFDEFTM